MHIMETCINHFTSQKRTRVRAIIINQIKEEIELDNIYRAYKTSDAAKINCTISSKKWM